MFFLVQRLKKDHYGNKFNFTFRAIPVTQLGMFLIIVICIPFIINLVSIFLESGELILTKKIRLGMWSVVF